MAINEFNTILAMYKALADENRLRMMGALSQKEHNVGELAELMELTEPTISHHLSKLRIAGLVNIRANGTQRFYRANRDRMKLLKSITTNIEEVAQVSKQENDTHWIDALDLSDEDRKVLKNYTLNGKLTQIPTKEKKLLAILHWLISKFEAGRTYTEKEVNAIITECHDDYATLRRDLVEFGFMRRERAGSNYWVAEE